MSGTVAHPGLGRWLAPLLESLPPLAIFDAHTHLAVDGDGNCEPSCLTAALEQLDAHAVTFASHVEGGDYRHPNDAVIEAAAASGGRLVPFCRLNPHTDPLEEGGRAVAAGARGIKLDPRSECFTLAHPGVKEIFALANENELAVLIHAGRGIDPLGTQLLELTAAYPTATVILAHAAISDLAWIAAELDAHPNVLFDTAWWNPVDLLALFALVAPGRILFGSDTPSGDPALNALLTLRCALAAGLDHDQVQAVMGGQLRRLLAREELADLGLPPGIPALHRDVPFDRAITYLAAAWGNATAGGTGQELLELARMALEVGPSHPHRETCDAAIEALDMPANGPRGLDGIAIAAAIAATPQVRVAQITPLYGRGPARSPSLNTTPQLVRAASTVSARQTGTSPTYRTVRVLAATPMAVSADTDEQGRPEPARKQEET